MSKLFPRSIRKFLRKEKARLRRQLSDSESEAKILQLVKEVKERHGKVKKMNQEQGI